MSESHTPWFRQVNGEQWRAFLATFFGWLLDGFDFTIMTFIAAYVPSERPKPEARSL